MGYVFLICLVIAGAALVAWAGNKLVSRPRQGFRHFNFERAKKREGSLRYTSR